MDGNIKLHVISLKFILLSDAGYFGPQVDVITSNFMKINKMDVHRVDWVPVLESKRLLLFGLLSNSRML